MMITRTAIRRTLSTLKPNTKAQKIGFVFDIDGVLVRGREPIPGAAAVLQELTDRKLPFVVLTNGGGETEAKKTEVLAEKLQSDVISSEQMILCHTPMRALASKYREKLVLAIGKDPLKTHEIMRNYGFENVATIEDLHSQHPDLYPDIKVSKAAHMERWHEPFAAVFILIDPIYWGRELQIIMDVVSSHQGQLGTKSEAQHVPVYNSCSDFEYVGDFPNPRYGAGAFRTSLEDLHFRTTGYHLDQTLFGKPQKSSFEYAEQLLMTESPDLQTIYMIGDNPYTDIKGANEAGLKWKSVLTRSGMFTGSGNHTEHPADEVVEDVVHAVETILKIHE